MSSSGPVRSRARAAGGNRYRPPGALVLPRDHYVVRTWSRMAVSSASSLRRARAEVTSRRAKRGHRRRCCRGRPRRRPATRPVSWASAPAFGRRPSASPARSRDGARGGLPRAGPRTTASRGESALAAAPRSRSRRSRSAGGPRARAATDAPPRRRRRVGVAPLAEQGGRPRRRRRRLADEPRRDAQVRVAEEARALPQLGARTRPRAQIRGLFAGPCA